MKIGEPHIVVSLSNCADEPIHIPGFIQPHGAMLVFSSAMLLVAWSSNVQAVLALEVRYGLCYTHFQFPPPLNELLVLTCGDLFEEDCTASFLEIHIAGEPLDCVVHAYKEHVYVEFEIRSPASETISESAFRVHQRMDRFRRKQSIGKMLDLAVRHIREVTGFDRVMAYRFRHDDSGEVVSEACAGDMMPYLGMRYPASDIPAQARRLYVVNTLRFIPDVRYEPVAMVGRVGDPAVDMSYCTLRSVSPIHVAYLQNMGVGASMSISIVIEGRLWGLIACHHRSPRLVSYMIRKAIDTLAHTLASTAAQLELSARSRRLHGAADLLSRLSRTVEEAVDLTSGLKAHAAELCKLMRAHALVMCRNRHIESYGRISAEDAQAIVESLSVAGNDSIFRSEIGEWPATSKDVAAIWPGLIGFCFDMALNGWVVFLREDQCETVRWGGEPGAAKTDGPHGARLTPRGSFEEWKQTVLGTASPWDAAERIIGEQLAALMRRVTAMRQSETERARSELLAMLGHDLRTPLQSIAMAAAIMVQQKQSLDLAKRIQDSANRMARLISQVLDMSRLTGNLTLAIAPENCDLAKLIGSIVSEARFAYPAARYAFAFDGTLVGRVDADRIAQVVSNLLGNAASHGEKGQVVTVTLEASDGHVVICVRNRGLPIPPNVAANLFDPFKRTSLNNRRNSQGLGLGLYIVAAIVSAHGGTVDYSFRNDEIVFCVKLPLVHGVE